MSDNGENVKTGIFLIIGLLMITAIFGAPLAEEYSQVKFLETISEKIARFIFGIQPDTIQDIGGENTLTPYAATIVYLLIWLIIFVTFGDIISSFSSFSPGVSWTIAFCIATISAFTGGINNSIVEITGVFAKAGTGAVYLALGVSFLVFLAVELGITPLMGMIKRRKMMQLMVRSKMTIEQAADATKNLSSFNKIIARDGDDLGTA